MPGFHIVRADNTVTYANGARDWCASLRRTAEKAELIDQDARIIVENYADQPRVEFFSARALINELDRRN